MTIADFIVTIKGNTDDLTQKVNEVDKGLKKVEHSAKSATTNGSKPFFSSMVGGFKSIIAPAALAVASIAAVGAGLFKVGKAGEDFKKVEKAFNNIAIAAGTSGDRILDTLKISSQGAVSTEDLMKSSSNAIKLMGSDVIEKLPQLMKVAVASAASTGEDVTKTFNDIIVATGRQSIEILDNVGISAVTTRKYMDEYAKSQGTTTDKLDAAGKKAAFFYATTIAGNEIIAAQGADMDKLVSGFDQLSTAGSDFADSFSKAVSPVLSDAAKSISEIISNLNLIIKSRSGTGREKISAEVALAQKDVDKYSKVSSIQRPSSGSWFDENLASTREVYDRNILDPAKKKLAEKQKELEAYDLANPVVNPVVAPIKTTGSSKPSSGDVDTSHKQMMDMNKSFQERLLKDKEAFYRRQSVLDGTNTEQAKKDQQTANDLEIQALNNKFAIELEAAAEAGADQKALKEAQGLEMAALVQAQQDAGIAQFGLTVNQYKDMSQNLATTTTNLMIAMSTAITENNLKTLGDFKKFIKDMLLQLITMVETTIMAMQIKLAVEGIGYSLTTFGASLAAASAAIAATLPYFAVAETLKAGVRAMATGGIVTGPTLALVGEGKDNEAVLPLNNKTFSELAKGITQQLNTDNSSTRNINLILDGKVISTVVDKHRDEKANNMGAKSYSFASAY